MVANQEKGGEPITPARAREALESIAELKEPVTPEHWAVAALTRVLTEFAEARQQKDAKEEMDCYGCHAVRLTAPFASDHFARCPKHPAVDRARAVREAIGLAPAIVKALDLQPVRVDETRLAQIDALAAAPAPKWTRRWYYVPSDRELRDTLALLTGPRRSEFASLEKDYLTKLEGAVDSWERMLHRGSDPCPYCGAATPLGDVVGHLLHCKRHPAVVLAEEALTALAASIGKAGAEALVKLVLERNGQISGLRTLLDACDRFDADLGWNGDCAYARGYVEEALHRAQATSKYLIDAEDRGFRPPLEPITEAASGSDFARPVWRALLRVGSDGPTPGSHGGTAEDVALLKAAAEETLRLQSQLGDDVQCPACRRSGVWIERAVSHVATCLMHPAISRHREATAELVLLTSVLRETRAGGELPKVDDVRRAHPRLLAPSAYYEDGEERRAWTAKYLADRWAKLKFLLSQEDRTKYPSLVESYRDELASPLSEWQRYHAAATSTCPYCGAEHAFEALLRHILECSAHPSAARAKAAEDALRGLGAGPIEVGSRLWREADRARVATARLLEFSLAFTNCFGDDERGRATVPRSAEPGWNRARQEARDALAALEARGGPDGR
jgi:hypothetical protein